MKSEINRVYRMLAAITLAASVLSILILTGAPALAADDKSLGKGQKAIRKGEYQAAEKIYRELLAKDSRDIQARLGLSFALLKQRNLQDAYDHAARVILIDPLSARAHALLGAAILAGGDFRTSVEEFRTALALDEDEALAVAGLAMVDFYENRLVRALPALRRAVSLDPNEPDYIFSLAQTAARSERYREAADAYERFLAVAPKTDSDRRARIIGLIDFLRYLGRQGSLYVATGALRTSIAFEAFDNRPIMNVRLNGQKQTFRFVLDTGSGMSVISNATAKRLGLKPVAKGGLARAVGGGGRFEIVYGHLSSIQMGDAAVENVPVYIRHFYDTNIPVDGYLGLSVVSRFLMSIDYGTRRMTLLRQNQSDVVESWSVIRRGEDYQALAPVELNDSIIEVPLRTTSSGFLSGEVALDGFDKTLNFIIDTAASITVVSEKLSKEEALLDLVKPSNMRVFGAAGIAENVMQVQLPKVGLGLTTLEKINAAVLDLEPVNETAGFKQSGIIGGNFLRHFRVYFDFARGALHLEPLNKIPKNSEINPEIASKP